MYYVEHGDALGCAVSGQVVVTGSAGVVGAALVKGMTSRPVRDAPELVLNDVPGAALAEAESEVRLGDLSDPRAADRVLAGATAVVHLAGQPRPDAPWPLLVGGNVDLTASVLDAAERQGVARVVLAGSVHAVGDAGPAAWPVDPDGCARPCCRYGVTKAAVELLARDHARAVPGTSVVTLRLGLVAARPRWRGEALGWTPSDALADFVVGALTAPPGYHCVHAVATPDGRRRYDTGPTRSLLGHERPVRPEDLAGLTDELPELAAGCRLWRHPPERRLV